MTKVTLSGYITVPESDLQVVLEELPQHIDLTRSESGCIVFNVIEDPGDPCRFTVYEEFRDTTSFNLHQQRVRTSDWGRVTQNVERHFQIDGIST